MWVLKPIIIPKTLDLYVAEWFIIVRDIMPKLTPCLSFKGPCNEAIELYKTALGAKVQEKILFKQRF